MKDHVASVAENLTWDSLQTSEWQKLAILKDLLLPFAEHRKVLESDTNSLLVVPELLDLKGHLSEFSEIHARSYNIAATLAQKMSASMELRFSLFIDVTKDRFSPIAAAACFVEPNVSAEVLIENEDEGIPDLLKKAEKFIINTVTPRVYEEETDEDEENGQAETAPLPKRPRFRFFSSSHPARPRTSIRQETQKCKDMLSQADVQNESGIGFWSSQSDTVFKLLKPLALDLLAVPASPVFAKRVFGVTVDLSTGRRNRTRTTLERSAFLKLNNA